MHRFKVQFFKEPNWKMTFFVKVLIQTMLCCLNLSDIILNVTEDLL